MPLKSMTGFGRGQASTGGLTIDVELSSVNRKQLDIRVGLPRELSALEARMSRLIQKKVSRGSLAGSVRVGLAGKAKRMCISVDSEAAQALVHELRRVGKELGLDASLSVQDLLKLPDLVKFESVPEDTERVWPTLRRAVSAALLELDNMRMREGQSLQKDIARRFRLLSRLVAGIRKRAPRVVEAYRRNLKRRIEDAGVPVDTADAPLLREIAIFADRSDISEEVVRLESHLAQVEKLMGSRKPVGRTLDFLCQEMLREINTVGSKANDTEISTAVVRFKADLESVREQVQNVE
jgi:uncharacterized protein (TIGR00255 family)